MIDKSNSLLGDEKLEFLLSQLRLTLLVYGDVAEVGVYKGGTAVEIAKTMFSEKRIHLFDTFKGIVNSSKEHDIHPDGDFADVDLSELQGTIGANAIFHVGTFPDTFYRLESTWFSFVHSDTDTYFGAKATLDKFIQRMSIGGRIVFDDWKWPACPGIKEAIDEFVLPVGFDGFEHGNQYVIVRK